MMIRNNWSDDSSIQEKWNTLKRALSDAAEADLGHSKGGSLISFKITVQKSDL